MFSLNNKILLCEDEVKTSAKLIYEILKSRSYAMHVSNGFVRLSLNDRTANTADGG